ncbi:MAG: enoyl-CoA hydratase [Candidatus Omnitrophica bacterium CG11_big_fil_rev_8_21_14_0_20_45_26]|uniref:Enoyl-CoA hydratase n=1 Tax=Candidatus Abzuiibacterium crystallinum TaxID=1974748 RepID=A0A2H0LPL4_9BACT|nr:MAG: enoyl-CoA hydratase [Candidatus Omnitrophica bacterium CG11_big_fil_rev_8_21_14_0_20_45_26]PIW64342.1 MAG: enoyl-CoA hydratase [Candidatus Omnitrophica bacterium CG12_big_fil_rev_8_21_14_0_65_45_16]
MGDDGKKVKFKLDENVGIITIDRPPVNALSSEVMQQLNETLEKCLSDSNVKVMVITGAGSFAFVAGADVKEINGISDAKEGARLASEGQAILKKIESSKKPVIAAINAVCLGGGNELALACHLRIASDRAKFGQPEINLGIIPGFGGTQRLTRLCGIAKARELCLTGDMVTAQEALRIGLINKMVPDSEVLKQSVGLAKKIAKKGQRAVQLVQQVITEGFSKTLDEGLALEAQLFGEVCTTQDKKEGVQAFLEKRQPNFTDS